MTERPAERRSRGHFTIPLIGLQVERRTDLLAGAAFIMALAGALAQLYYGWLGAKVSVFAPEQVTLVLHDYGNGQRFLRVGARMAYVNAGRPGYNATIRRETVQFDVAGRTYEQVWQSVHRFDAHGNRLDSEYVAEARPFPINAGSSVSREVYFAPHPQRCSVNATDCDPYREFLSAGAAIAAISELQTMRFTFRSWVFGQDEPKSVGCTIDVPKTMVDRLVLNGWDAPTCWPDKR